uniref:uncharacterized protein LOC117162619 n=1 Tax=Bombus vancouverensis nearcticus TaxID=2705178 RepID=UPI001439B757|nr:uncharacterized protein LOC117162619 [Bombus vancouverensis nearcticus]XP_033204634.1 uncharacterized protein LOC117165325 [Bombus vancouverensis nearcticus]
MALHPSQLSSLRRAVGGCSEVFQTTSPTCRRDTPSNRLSCWQHIQKLKQHFWRRWHREYLNELHIRNKWSKGSHDIREGTIVLLREDNVPPMQWPLGRIIKTQPGADGIIRTAIVRTATSTLERSIKRMVPLPSRTTPDDSEHIHGYKKVRRKKPK